MERAAAEGRVPTAEEVEGLVRTDPPPGEHHLVRMVKQCWSLAGRWPEVWEMSFSGVRFLALLADEERRRDLLDRAVAIRAAGDRSENAEGWLAYVAMLEG